MPRTPFRTALLMLLCCLFAGSQAFAQRVTVTTDNPRADYAAGETVTFRIESERRGDLEWEVRHNLRTPEVLASGTESHDSDVTEVRFTFREPTFVTFRARIDGREGFASATFSRNEIKALTNEPGDYDEFWRKQKEELARVPLDVNVYLKERHEYSSTYQFSCAQIDGRRVHGYITIPDGEGPFPATMRLPSYGDSPNIVRPDQESAERANCIALAVNIHDVAPDQRARDAYEPNVITKPEGIYYRYAILGAMRAIDYLATRDEWNGRELCVYGESQGGGLSIITAGLDDRVTHLIQSVAALSQHGGYRFGRPSGFPYYLERATAVYSTRPDSIRAVLDATRYYDAVFAARRFKGPSLHFANYLDDVCPPATAYAARNEMRGPKVTLHTLYRGHPSVTEYVDLRREFLRQHFPDANDPPFPFADDTRGRFVDAGDRSEVDTDQSLELRPRFGYDRTSYVGEWPARWEQVEGPGRARFDDEEKARTRVKFDEPGRYVLRLRALDYYPREASKFYELTDEVVIDVRQGMTDPDTMRTDTMPMDTMRTDTMRTDTMRTDTMPRDTMRTDTMPRDTMPSDTMRTDTMLSDTTGTIGANDLRRAGLTEVRVGPNPVRSYVDVRIQLTAALRVRARLVDATGREVWSLPPPPPGKARSRAVQFRVNAAQLPPGTYALVLTTDLGMASVPLIKL